MSTPRVKALAKLFLLLGLPLTLLGGLFGSGVYLGQSHRRDVLHVEKAWLGMDVEVPSEPWLAPVIASARDPKPTTTTPATTPTPPPTNPTTPPPTTPPTDPETPPTDATPTPPKPVETAPPTLLEAPVRPAMPVTVALADPLPGDLRAAQRAPLTLKIKALVDPGVAPDPFAYVQRIVEWSSEVLGASVGVDLELTAVVRWDGAEATLCEHPREGADVILGFSRGAFAAADPLISKDCALVGVSSRSRQAPHLRPVLFSLGRLLGATAIGDPGSDAWRRGSWMADVLADDAQPLWIDPESRRAMLLGKDAAPWTLGSDADTTADAAGDLEPAPRGE